ncbi:MAG: histidyl-tRNA synthetase [Candidatus Paceibacteria bacterium]|jgi:histidyl-tRNA synthetase
MTHTPTDFLKVASNTAEHFGFKTADQIKKAPECKACEKKAPHTVTGTNKRIDAQQGLLSSAIATYCDEKFHALEEKPVLLFNTHQVPRTGESAVSFHIFNVEKSIAEAILIQVARGVATDLGYGDHTVKINSLGCTDSVTRYGRELGNYLRKRIDTMPENAREAMKEHPMLALQSLLDEKHDLAYSSPNPLEYLSDSSRKHFREIIEYLDMSETPYEIDSKMIGHHECYSDAIFALEINTEEDKSPITARGGRFDEFAGRNTETRTPSAGVVITLNKSKAPARNPRTPAQKPSVYVVQLGFGPKVRSLLLVDSLKAAGIPVLHDLTSDSLSAQLRDAEERGVNYTIIVGQKEFVEGTVILRDMNARNQEYVPQDTLIRKLKRRNGVVMMK